MRIFTLPVMAKSLLGVIPADLTEEDFFPEQSLEELEKEEKADS